MTVYIALLRGINVGGHNKVKMADLREMCTELGLQNVQTYIQSGNILFASDEDSDTLRTRLETEIERRFSITSPVILRTATELAEMIQDCPVPVDVRLEAAQATDAETFYVALLLEPPSAEAVQQVTAYQNRTDDFYVSDRNVYLLLRGGIRNSKLAGNVHRLNSVVTIRNWRTMNKLNELARAMTDE